MPYDLIRFLDFAMFGVGCAFMLITNILAFRVLRPPKKLGFLWWHVTTVSLAFLALGIVVLHLVFSRFGHVPTWRTPLSFAGFFLFMISQILIFSVELQRYASTLVVDKLNKGEAR